MRIYKPCTLKETTYSFFTHKRTRAKYQPFLLTPSRGLYSPESITEIFKPTSSLSLFERRLFKPLEIIHRHRGKNARWYRIFLKKMDACFFHPIRISLRMAPFYISWKPFPISRLQIRVIRETRGSQTWSIVVRYLRAPIKISYALRIYVNNVRSK